VNHAGMDTQREEIPATRARLLPLLPVIQPHPEVACEAEPVICQIKL
jgi:hypothetical protein